MSTNPLKFYFSLPERQDNKRINTSLHLYSLFCHLVFKSDGDPCCPCVRMYPSEPFSFFFIILELNKKLILFVSIFLYNTFEISYLYRFHVRLTILLTTFFLSFEVASSCVSEDTRSLMFGKVRKGNSILIHRVPLSYVHSKTTKFY